MDKFDILLVEDDENDSRAMIEEIARHENLLLAKATSSCKEAYEYIVNNLPSAVILDLEMHYGEGDGMELLKRLHTARLKTNPYIVVTTNNVSDVTRNRTKHLGAGYCFCKLKTDYSPKMVIDCLETMLLCEDGEQSKETAAQREKRLRNRICDIFDSFNLLQSTGYDYLVEAIMLYMKTGDRDFVKLMSIEKDRSVDSITKAMQYALSTTWSNEDTNRLTEIYKGPVSFKKNCPEYLPFVLYYARQLDKEF